MNKINDKFNTFSFLLNDSPEFSIEDAIEQSLNRCMVCYFSIWVCSNRKEPHVPIIVVIYNLTYVCLCIFNDVIHKRNHNRLCFSIKF